ncbi:MAG: 23S rRNA (uracil(1939)-C(5))-methyltransferase RlmD [Christensenellales bacterium]
MLKCKYSSRCGGCENLDKDISWQLKEKTSYIKELFKSLNCDSIDDCVGDYYPYKYRNKIHLAFGELKGRTIIGFYEEGSTKITDIDSCVLFGDWAQKLIAILREYISRFKIRPYSKLRGGIIRYAHARCVSNRLQLTLVVTTDNFAGRNWLYNRLLEDFSEVSFYLNINKRTDHAIFDKNFKFVKGNKYLNFTLCGVKVALSPSSFLQVNLGVAEKMYKTALELLDIKPSTMVLDLYSGIGITSILFAKKASKVISIEEVPSAVDNAKLMSKINSVNNVVYLCGKCEKEISKLKLDKDIVVFLDPARAGLDTNVINVLKTINPRRIVYMSCNPETCLRDIQYLVSDNKYNINVKSFNMFPFTKHIELLVELGKIDQ